MTNKIRSAILNAESPFRRTPFTCMLGTEDLLKSTALNIKFPKIGKLSSQEDYFRFQHETSSTTDAIKDAVAEVYRSRVIADFPKLDDVVLHIHNKRKNHVRLRAAHNRMYTLALGGRDNVFTPRVGASIEFLLEDMYYLNQFFDSKSGPNAATNIIAAIESNDLFWPLLVPPNRNEFEKAKIFGELNNIYNQIISGFYYGEYIDCIHNIWAKQEDRSLSERLESCNERTYFIDALFFQGIVNMASKVVSSYLGKTIPKSKLEALSRYAHNFGMGLQVVNDIADFVPADLNKGTSEKSAKDSYSDILNGKMTYPVIAMLEMSSAEDRKKVARELERKNTGYRVQENFLREITNLFVKSGAYTECRALARKYKRECEIQAREFDDPARFLLQNSAVILDSNRYYTALSSLRNVI